MLGFINRVGTVIWPPSLINSVDETKHSFPLPHRRSTTVSLETKPSVICLFVFFLHGRDILKLQLSYFSMQNQNGENRKLS